MGANLAPTGSSEVIFVFILNATGKTEGMCTIRHYNGADRPDISRPAQSTGIVEKPSKPMQFLATGEYYRQEILFRNSCF